MGSAERGETERSRYSKRSDVGQPGDDAFVDFLDDVDGSHDSEEKPHEKDNTHSSSAPTMSGKIGNDSSAFNLPPMDHHEESHHVVDKVQLEKAEKYLDTVLADTAQEIQKSLESLYNNAKSDLEGSTLEMLGYTMGLHADSSKRVKLLTRRERRLEIAMMHGEYGKCCCKPAAGGSVPVCTWSVGAQLLGKFSRKCDMDKTAYTEFLGYPEEGSLEEQMLDECGKTPEWLQYARNQIVNECDFFDEKLDRDINGLGTYLR